MASKTPTLVSTKWLFEEVSRGRSNLRVLDSSWYSAIAKRDPFKEYQQRHIPGALFYDLVANSDKTSPYDHTLPSPDAFAKSIGKLGVSSDTHVVVYDGSDQAGFFSASRLWWMLRVFGHQQVSILNGGLLKWISDGYEVSDKIPEIDEAEFVAKFKSEGVKSFEEMDSNIKEKRFQVMDARPKGMFDGTSGPTGTRGHIPNAINLPFITFIDEVNRSMRGPEELRKTFDDKGIDLNKPLTAICLSGVSSCVLIVSANLAGKDDACLYDGAWAEYSKRAKTEDIISQTPLG